VDSPWAASVDATRFAATFAPLREFAPSWIFSTHLPPAPGLTDRLLENLLAAPDGTPFVGPDQAALEAMLRGFEPVPA
jgi:hypothetical protein